jgi:hypothetical protein
MDSRKVIAYLKLYGQQQSYEAIRDAVDDGLERSDLEGMVEDGKLVHADGGVDGRGTEIVNYKLSDD